MESLEAHRLNPVSPPLTPPPSPNGWPGHTELANADPTLYIANLRLIEVFMCIPPHSNILLRKKRWIWHVGQEGQKQGLARASQLLNL